MSRIATTFEGLRAKGQKAFVGYCMAGFPGLGADLELGRGLLAAGADLLEIGVPFSDPLADGPVIQRASELALERGGGLRRALELARALRQETAAPLLLMSYLNPLLAPGFGRACREAAEAGVDGLIIPEVGPEEAGPLAAEARAAGLDLVLLAAPTSTPARLKRIAQAASGFIYFVSVAGVTGEHQSFDSQLATGIQGLRKQSALPICIGFGVSTPALARQAAGLADGAVAASAVLKPLLEGGPLGPSLEVARSIAAAVHGG